jgi:hypothetical protein
MNHILNAEPIMDLVSAITPDMLWGLNRIANRYRPMVSDPIMATLTPNREVEVILMDSGVKRSHPEFEGAKIEDLFCASGFASIDDDTGHGTSLASLVIGKTLGVFPGATIKVVKLFGNDYVANTNDLYDALDTISAYHTSTPNTFKVVLAAFGVPNEPVLASKLQALTDSGVAIIAAGGNTAQNVDTVAPAGVQGVFTVAASTIDDIETVQLYGTYKKIDIYAPGKNVGVASIDESLQYGISNGSSNSAAYVAGVVAMVASMFKSFPTVSEVFDAVKRDATPSALLVNSQVSGPENRLLHLPTSLSISSNQDYYAGNLVEGSDKPLIVQLDQLMPITTYENAFGELSYELVMSMEATEFASVSTASFGVATINLPQGFALPEGETVKQFYFSVKAIGEGMVMESPAIHFFVTSPDASELDIGSMMESLNAQTYLLSLTYGHAIIK